MPRMPRGAPEMPQVALGKPAKSSRPRPTERVLAASVVIVVVSWHARGGTTDPTALPPGHRLSHTTVVIDSAILVFREGLETILVLAAVTASFLGANKVYRRPVAAGAAAANRGGVGPR